MFSRPLSLSEFLTAINNEGDAVVVRDLIASCLQDIDKTKTDLVANTIKELFNYDSANDLDKRNFEKLLPKILWYIHAVATFKRDLDRAKNEFNNNLEAHIELMLQVIENVRVHKAEEIQFTVTADDFLPISVLLLKSLQPLDQADDGYYKNIIKFWSNIISFEYQDGYNYDLLKNIAAKFYSFTTLSSAAVACQVNNQEKIHSEDISDLNTAVEIEIEEELVTQDQELAFLSWYIKTGCDDFGVFYEKCIEIPDINMVLDQTHLNILHNKYISPGNHIISSYVQKRFSNATPATDWDIALLHNLRKEVIFGTYRNEDYKNRCLEYLDELESSKYTFPIVIQDETKPKWEALVNPISIIQSPTMQMLNNQIQQSPSLSQAGNGNIVVLSDVLSENGRLQGNKFVTDVSIGGQQVIFDVTGIDPSLCNSDGLKQQDTIKQQWNALVNTVTRDDQLTALINAGTHKHVLTHLPVTLLKELQAQQLLPANSTYTEGDPVVRIHIKALPVNQGVSPGVIYEILYQSKDKQDNLCYTLSVEVIVKKSCDDKVPYYTLDLNNICVKGFTSDAKYIFPTQYNRGYMESQLDTIHFTYYGTTPLNTRQGNKLENSIKCAIRFYATQVADKLSCREFEILINELKKTAIRLIKQPGNNANVDGFRFESVANDIVINNLKTSIRNIIDSNFVAQSQTNTDILNYYLNDISEPNKKKALMDVAKNYIDTLSIDEFNTLLAKSISVFQELPDQYQDVKDSVSAIFNKEIPLTFQSQLYQALEQSEKDIIQRKIKEFISSIQIDNKLDVHKLINEMMPFLIIKSLAENYFEANNKRYKTKSEHIARILSPSSNDNIKAIYPLLMIGAGIKKNLMDLFQDIATQEEAKNTDDIILKHLVRIRLQQDMNDCHRNIPNLNDNVKIYYERLMLISKNPILLNIFINGVASSLVSHKVKANELSVDVIRNQALDFIRQSYYRRVIMSDVEPEKVEIDDLVVMKVDGQLVVYWNQNGKIHNRSFREDSVNEISCRLPAIGSESTDLILIQAIKAKYGCIHKTKNNSSQVNNELLNQINKVVIADLLTQDISEDTQDHIPDAPPLYQSVVVQALKDKKNNYIDNIAEAVSKIDNIKWINIRHHITSTVLQLYPDYVKLAFDGILKEKRKLYADFFKDNLSGKFKPNHRQLDTIVNLAAVYELHYQRCHQLFGKDNDLTKNAAEKVKATLPKNSINIDKGDSKKAFSQYLIKEENEARSILDEALNDRSKDKDQSYLAKKWLAEKVIAVTRHHQYSVSNSKLFKNTFGALSAMCSDRNLILNDFEDKWFNEVLKRALTISQGTIKLEEQLIALEQLETTGRKFAQKQWVITRYVLNNKLDILHQFIQDIKNSYIKREAKCIDYKLVTSSLNDKGDTDKGNKFNAIVTETKKNYTNSDDQQNRFKLFPAQANNISEDSLKIAERHLAKEIVEIRMRKASQRMS